MRTRRPALALVPLVLSAVLAGCGSETSPGGEDADAVGSAPKASTRQRLPDPVLSTSDDEPLVTCGYPQSFPVSAVSDGVEIGAARGGLQEALDDLIGTGGMDAPAGLRRGDDGSWHALALSEESATIAAGTWDEGGTHRGGSVIGLEKDGPGWKGVSWGDCTLGPVLRAGLSWANISLSGRPGPSATEIVVAVSERECTSGRDPGPFLQRPAVVETDRNVTVYWTTKSPHGNQSCQGTPGTRRTITLAAPLGARVLLDGSSWPARRIS